MVLIICSFPGYFMEKLELHYGKYRHCESAIGVHNLTDESLRTGSSRLKSKSKEINKWSEILTVTHESVCGN